MQYQIKGETLPVVICQLEAGEKMITEGGAMSWMSPNMLMETSTNGGIGKAFGRMFSRRIYFPKYLHFARWKRIDCICIQLPGIYQSIPDLTGK